MFMTDDIPTDEIIRFYQSKIHGLDEFMFGKGVGDAYSIE